MALLPKTASDVESIDLPILPPRLLVTNLMHLPMMPTAERHGELITDLKTDRSRLRKTKMVGIGWLPQLLSVTAMDRGKAAALFWGLIRSQSDLPEKSRYSTVWGASFPIGRMPSPSA